MLFVDALSSLFLYSFFRPFFFYELLIPPPLLHNTEKDHEVVREEARDLMRQIQEKSVEYDPDRKVRLSVPPSLSTRI